MTAEYYADIVDEKSGWDEKRIVKAIERSRIAVCFVAMFLGHSDYFRTFAALTVFSLAGLTAVESFLFGDVSARAQIKFRDASPPTAQ